MKGKLIPPILLAIALTSSFKAWSLEGGSASFEEFRQGTLPYSVSVDMARNSSVTKNTSFSDTSYLEDLSRAQMPYGASERYAQAHMMNGSANFHWAAAKTDPRSPGFIINSMEPLMADPQVEIKLGHDIAASELRAAQAGDNSRKYIAAKLIKPNTGYFQTADNQQAYESAYDNVLLGRAEEALFASDQADALTYYNKQRTSFQESSDKQLEVGGYQREALMRAKHSADTFSDFFAFKGSISQSNLIKMPTTSSLVGGCQRNTPESEDLLAAYNYVMPRDEIEFYNFTPPQYSFDFCEQYVLNNASYLVQNQETSQKLGEIIEDSGQMVAGLNEISQKLSNDALTVPEITQILNSNPAWLSLGERSKAWEECAKNNCLDAYESAIKGVVTYPGYEKYLNSETLQFRKDVRQIRESGRMISSLSGSAKTVGLAPTSSGGLQSGAGDSDSRVSPNLSGGGDQLKHQGKDGPTAFKKHIATTGPQGQINVFYETGAGLSTSDVYVRDEHGILRGPSGKPVQGYEAKAQEDLFQIISRRYMSKFMKDDL